MLAGILAAIAIGTQNSEAGQAAAAAVLGTQAQTRLNFSRSYENEADRVGMQLLDTAGFDPAAMAIFFERLQGAARYYRRPPEYLSTHPVTSSRIAEARSRVAQLGFRQHTDSDRYRLVRAKVRVMMEPDNERLLAEFNEEMQRRAPSPSPGLRYGIALVKIRMGKLGEAREELEALARERPNEIVLQVALADVMRRDGNEAKALTMLDDSWRLLPDNRLVTRAYVDALLATKQTEEALRVLIEHERLVGLDAEMLRQRAEALAALGRTAESQAALAEHYYRKGELDRAIHQLTLAAQQPDNDFYRASRIEARLEQIRDEQAARAQR
jgi:predicted Zn-dependent protease